MSKQPVPGSAAWYPEGEVARCLKDPASDVEGRVIRGPLSWCGYVGVPFSHPLHGLDELKFACHFGITFRGEGEGDRLERNYFWWGWDYGHFTDRLHPVGEDALVMPEILLRPDGKDWTLDEVAEHVLDVMMSLREALEANEAIVRETLGRVKPSEPLA